MEYEGKNALEISGGSECIERMGLWSTDPHFSYRSGFPMVGKTLLSCVCCLALASSAGANNSLEANGDCFDQAAAYHQVNVEILRSIAFKENSSCRPVIRKNTNQSVDVGCMQINSVHFNELARYGVKPADLLDTCKNIYVGAWHYKKKILKYGNNWLAVGAYHSETVELRNAYASDVYLIWKRRFG